MILAARALCRRHGLRQRQQRRLHAKLLLPKRTPKKSGRAASYILCSDWLALMHH